METRGKILTDKAKNRTKRNGETNTGYNTEKDDVSTMEEGTGKTYGDNYVHFAF